MAERRAPRIRFKGFEEDWEQRKFDDMFECCLANNTLSRAQLSYDEGMIFNIHYGDILTKYGAILDVQTATIPYIVEGKLEEFKNCLLQEGDIVIADTAEDETAGKTCEVSNLQGAAIVAGLHTVVGRPKIKMAIGYLGYYLNSGVYRNQLIAQMQGIKVLSLSRHSIRNTKVGFPITKEQACIAGFLFRLDSLLSLHQRKLEKLKILRKAMLEKMFPKNGTKVPEIRFSGFTEDWEQRKLGNLVQFSKGTGYSKADLKETGTPIILYGRLYTKYETVIREVDTFAEAKTGSVYSRGGEVIVPASGETAEDISIASVVEKSGVLLGGDLNIITPPEGLDSAFLAISISNGKSHDDMTRMAQGKSVVHLHNTDLEKIDLVFPDYEEQVQISGYFSKLYTLITLHQRKPF